MFPNPVHSFQYASSAQMLLRAVISTQGSISLPHNMHSATASRRTLQILTYVCFTYAVYVQLELMLSLLHILLHNLFLLLLRLLLLLFTVHHNMFVPNWPS
jgi:hypothetical protein